MAETVTSRTILVSLKQLFFLLWVVTGIGPALQAQVPTRVEQKADYMEYDKNIAGGAYRLIRNVVFSHEGAFMYCDSAYYYPETNSLDAFSRVHIVQGDTADLYGDFLHYDGNTRFARVLKNVRLIGKNTRLTTQALDFDLRNNIGYYQNHADIVSNENRLVSREGFYYSNRQMYYFRDSVVLVNPDYTIYSDTLQYNTDSRVAYFFGPTEIVGDSSYIYCENGWFNTQTNKSMLKIKALVRNKEQTITGDSLYYERDSGYGEGFGNIELNDKEQNIILKGNHAYIYQQEDRALLTDSAMFIFITDEDSVYVHADTLRTLPDTAGNRQMKAYHRVRLFKSNLQGVCDSLYYTTADSILKLYDKPVLWSGGNQLSSEYIEIRTRNQQINQLVMDQLAFIINQEDTVKFNQVKGKTMICHFRNNELYRIDVNGNGQTVYYAKDNNQLIGVNLAQSSDLVITVKENKIDKIRFINKPTATLYPLLMAPKEELILKDFKWHEEDRPKDRNDIFR
jgi:lipopolysaccharide export system protein LptA